MTKKGGSRRSKPLRRRKGIFIKTAPNLTIARQEKKADEYIRKMPDPHALWAWSRGLMATGSKRPPSDVWGIFRRLK